MFRVPPLSMEQWIMLGASLLVFVALSLYSIWDAFHRDFGSNNAKFGWIQLIVLVPFLGGLAYLIFGKKRGRKF
jgi:hypothetical protein